MEKNCSRQAWNTFYRCKLGWKVPLSHFNYDDGQGNSVVMPYVSPKVLLTYMMENHPDIVVGGATTQQERSVHLEAFWQSFQLHQPNHKVFEEHKHNLQSVLPVLWHGDEGRGKRRSNTVVVALETPIGIHTTLRARKRSWTCDCKPPQSMKLKYNRVKKTIPQHLKHALMKQRTNMTGHSFLQHWTLFVIPGASHHQYPGLLQAMMKLMADEFKALFYDGISIGQRNYCVAVCGHKGDLKWFTKVAMLDRSYEHQGRTRNILCCHECMAGQDHVPWEEVNTEMPAWAHTRFAQRPWSTAPPLAIVPFTPFPEEQLKRDPFHTCKMGVFRDHTASTIAYLIHEGFFGTDGDFDTKLKRAHGAFMLYCRATSQSPALRSFTRALFMYKNFRLYPYSNVKGSDNTLILKWLCVQIAGFLNDDSLSPDVTTLNLMKDTCHAALGIFHVMNNHGVALDRPCAITLYCETVRCINGFAALASRSMNQWYNLWGLKPKLHMLKHSAVELHEALQRGDEVLLNWSVYNCEQNEDVVGRVSRLSRRMDTRTLCRRVLQSTLLKGCLLHRRCKLSNCA